MKTLAISLMLFISFASVAMADCEDPTTGAIYDYTGVARVWEQPPTATQQPVYHGAVVACGNTQVEADNAALTKCVNTYQVYPTNNKIKTYVSGSSIKCTPVIR